MREVNSMFVVTQGQKCIYKWRAFQRHPYPLVVVPLDLLFFHGYLATINQSVIFHFKESGVHTFGLWNSWVPRKLCLGRGLSNGVSDKDSFGTPAFPGGNKNDKLICCLLLFKQTQAGWHSAILTLEREREREKPQPLPELLGRLLQTSYQKLTNTFLYVSKLESIIILKPEEWNIQ